MAPGPGTPAPAFRRLTLPVSERDHIRGPRNAPVTFVEYGDFECPDCDEAKPLIEAVREELGDQLRFIYRHFPLSQIHPHATLAAQAAEAAGAQGKFWEMHDMLFEHQRALDERSLAGYATEIGLVLAPFLDALARHVHMPRVREDSLSGVRSGVNGTPAFFVNDIRYDGPRQFDSLMAAMEIMARTPR